MRADETLTEDDRPLVARHFREERAALEAIHRTITFYRVNLDLAERLHSMNLDPPRIDRAIKISDEAAPKAICWRYTAPTRRSHPKVESTAAA